MTVLADKMLVLGVDGMDPRLAKKLMDDGRMPNLKKIVERGSARTDLRMLGALPTITPPLWTTLATGAYPNTHGITCFWNQHPEKLDTLIYALDSRNCKAEQLWNVFAENGKKTLVWHWPGSSWPPSSQSPNLHVVDGTQPARVNTGVAGIDWEKYVIATPEIQEVVYKPKSGSDTGAGCILSNIDAADEKSTGMLTNLNPNNKESFNIELSHEDGDMAIDVVPFDIVNSPLKPAHGWTDAPADALEFTIVISNGLVRRLGLVLKNEAGIYDKVAIYKSKKALTPMVVLQKDVMAYDVIDDYVVKDDLKKGNRNMYLLELEPDGSKVRLWLSGASDIANNQVFHPKSLLSDIVENVGIVPSGALSGGNNPELVRKLIIPSWDYYCQWQAKCLNYLLEANDYEMIFSHLHNVDAMGHFFWHFAKHRAEVGNDEVVYQGFLKAVYEQTDRYFGEFVHLLDKGWTLFIVSDHGLVCSTEEHVPLIGDPFGVNAIVMQELGFTTLKKDAQGQNLREIDWAKTRAIATRGNHIWLNIKGRNPDGIVEPEDQYMLEDEIISALYGYRLDGRRVINVAIRNKEAELLGMNGPECGDIIYWLEEGFNRVHGDTLSTAVGYANTSVSPIFVAAGKGIKAGVVTERVVRQVDVAPTIAVLGGVRMPAQCEGAPLYQILEK